MDQWGRSRLFFLTGRGCVSTGLARWINAHFGLEWINIMLIPLCVAINNYLAMITFYCHVIFIHNFFAENDMAWSLSDRSLVRASREAAEGCVIVVAFSDRLTFLLTWSITPTYITPYSHHYVQNQNNYWFVIHWSSWLSHIVPVRNVDIHDTTSKYLFVTFSCSSGKLLRALSRCPSRHHCLLPLPRHYR